MSGPVSPETKGVAKLVKRRNKVRLWWSKDASGSEARWDPEDGPPPTGLALSGGGIRSATFALGAVQGLAKAPNDALGKIDVLSTVSGGGYCGCFLRGLFVPDGLRGIAPAQTTASDEEVAAQYRFARAVLASDPCVREIAGPAKAGDEATAVRNPLWWLREHSRYLAPTGMTDYGFAVAYLLRNWLAMAYLAALACVALGAFVVGGEAAIVAWTRYGGARELLGLRLSPVLDLVLLPVAAVAVLMIAYWTTQAMSTNERDVDRQQQNLGRGVGYILAAAAAVAIALAALRLGMPAAPALTALLGATFWWVVLSGIAASVAGALLAWVLAIRLQVRGAMLTAELRLMLTEAVASANAVLLLIVVAGIIDSLAAWLVGWLRAPGFWGSVGALLLPVLPFLIKKVPDWFGSGRAQAGTAAGVVGLLRRFAKTVALVLGLVLYGMVAVAALALVHAVTWTGAIWNSDPNWVRWGTFATIAWVLACLLGQSTGFINLSSLHSLYSARLTRAYLGASNVARLRKVIETARAAPVTENHEHDYIQPRVYGEVDLPAPIHIINVTLNETVDARSQIVSRDRKGDILSVEPEGLRVGDTLRRWDRLWDERLKTRRPENISLGQWIAISGAAASSGMGRMTSLGFALAFTFANVRLGYWWWSPRLCPKVTRTKGFYGFLGRNFGTFVYLFNEATCRYSRGYFRKYLTDGGHYENSGAYVLIRRRVPLILVTDNGADPDYSFADLETLVRQVRIDLGAETTILGGTDLSAALGRIGAIDRSIFVDPHADPDWRTRMTDPEASAYVLVLGVAVGGETLTVIWIKPRLIPGVPADVSGYQLTTKAFPQQPTGDQFFDEAQWESYRKLGEFSMTRLLDTCPRLLA